LKQKGETKMSKKNEIVAYVEDNYLVVGNAKYDLEGDLDLSHTDITALPDNLIVGGDLDLYNTDIAELPDNLTVGGDLDLRRTGIAELPDNLTVGGYLNLQNTRITALPDNLTFSGSINLRNTDITELPDNLTVGGSLNLSNTHITALPDNLTVGGFLDLRQTSITELPDNLTIGGSLDLRNTSITALPDNLTVGGGLDLRGSGITELPNNLTVGGFLNLSNTHITALPDNLTVGGDLNLRNTSITETSHVNRKVPDMLTWQGGRYILVDGIFSEVVHKRDHIWKVKQIGKTETSYVVTDGEGRFAHGSTIREAREDLIYKISDRDKSDYESLALDHEFTFQQAIEAYRVITGACALGTKQFVAEQSEVKETYTIKEIMEITKGQYGHNTFVEFFV
jgi:hypothetical protein